LIPAATYHDLCRRFSNRLYRSVKRKATKPQTSAT